MTDRLKKLEEILLEAGRRLLAQDVKVARHKTKNDLLTENDVAVETFIVAEIRKMDPAAEIVSEENYSNGSIDGRCYVIDPIDGTCNFAAGLPLFGIQVAYFENGEVKESVLHYPVNGDTVTAVKGDGTYWNGNKIKVNASASAKDGILIISDYYDDIPFPISKQFDLVRSIQPEFLKTRHFGAACVDFSMLVRGNALAYITYYSKVWDIAPGLLAATEAGCVFAAIDGGDYRYGSAGLVVANNEENLKIILKQFSEL